MPEIARSRSALLRCLALLALAGCEDTPRITRPEPELPADAVGMRIDCIVQVAAAQMSCGSVTTPAGVGAAVLLGGQGVNLRLVAAPGSYDAGARTLSIPVALQNLLSLPLGSAGGVDVHIFAGPADASGGAAVPVANPDGTAARFSDRARPFFRYPGPIDPRGTSAPRTWRFQVPRGVSAFVFTVFVETTLPAENGPLRWLLRSGDAAGAMPLRALGESGGRGVVAVGAAGVIIHSDGSSWARVPSPTPATLQALATDRGRTFAAGTQETVLTDQGGRWRVLRTAGTGALAGVWVSGDTVVAVGSRPNAAGTRAEGLVLRSTDGGATWTAATAAPTRLASRTYTDVWGQGATLFVVGYESTLGTHFDGQQVVAAEGVILRSTDGGATWAEVAGVPLSHRRLTGITGAGGTLYASGYQGYGLFGSPDTRQGVVLRSTDGAATWTASVHGPAGLVLNDVSASGGVVAAAGAQFSSVIGREDGVLLRSTDGGASWTRHVIPAAPSGPAESRALYAAWVDTAGKAYAAGAAGTVAVHDGAAWAEVQRPGAWSLSDVWEGGGTVLAVGEPVFGGGGVVLRSTDGGATWSQAPAPARLLGVDGDPEAVFATAFRLGTSAEPSRGSILRSADRGASWTEVHAFAGIPWDVWAAGGTVLVAGSTSAGAGVLLRSQDGGASWAAVGTLPRTLRDVRGVHASGATIIAVGWRAGAEGSAILRSTDGGATWTETLVAGAAPGRYVEGVWGSGSHWFVIANQTHYQGAPDDGVILRSTDGGATWTETVVQGRTLNRVDGADSSHVFVTASEGHVVQYDGARWVVVTTPTRHTLRGVAAVSPHRVHVVGLRGTILTGGR